MARQLLGVINGVQTPAGPNVTGKWVRIEGGGKRGVPCRVVATGNFAADPIVIEELIAGIPGQANSPYGQAADTGTVEPLGTIAAQGQDLLIDQPVEFIRARTGAAQTGTVTFCGVEMLE